jgi:surface carbohydrate biosynthesis protein (TIGR04326 family)
MFPSRNEFSIRPLPDYIVTNGPLFRDTLISEGVPQNRIRTGCALRHTYLWTSPHVQDNHRSVKSQPPLKILAATAIGYGDSVELIKKTACAFGGDRDYEVMIKCHPLVNVSEIKNDLGTLLKQDNIHFESRPIGELLPEVDVLLYTYTSVCYEALMHGVFPIFVLSENFINLDKLDAVPDIRWKAATSDDLRKLIKSFREMPDKTYENWKKKAHDVVLFALSPINEKCAESYVE